MNEIDTEIHTFMRSAHSLNLPPDEPPTPSELRDRLERYDLTLGRAADLVTKIGVSTTSGYSYEPEERVGSLLPPYRARYDRSYPVRLGELDAKTASGEPAYYFLEFGRESVEEKVTMSNLRIGGPSVPPKSEVSTIDANLWASNRENNDGPPFPIEYVLEAASGVFGRYVELSDEELLEQYESHDEDFVAAEAQTRLFNGILARVELQITDPANVLKND